MELCQYIKTSVNFFMFGTLLHTVGYLAKAKTDLSKNPGKAQINRPTLLRSLFTLGLLCKQFDFDSDVKPKNEVSSIQLNCKLHLQQTNQNFHTLVSNQTLRGGGYPLNPSVSISILLTGRHTFTVVLVGRRCSNIKRVISHNPLIVNFFDFTSTSKGSRAFVLN